MGSRPGALGSSVVGDFCQIRVPNISYFLTTCRISAVFTVICTFVIPISIKYSFCEGKRQGWGDAVVGKEPIKKTKKHTGIKPG